MDLNQTRSKLTERIHQPDAAALLLRVGVGVIGIYHGAQKLFGAFNGSGIEGFAGYLASMGVPLPTLNAYAAGSVEFFGGLLILLGLATRLTAIPFAFTFVVAVWATSGNGFDARNGGFEFPLLILLTSLVLIATGPGRWSLDAIAWPRIFQPTEPRVQPA